MVVTADAIAGEWTGVAKDGTGRTFEVRLDIRTGCELNQPCGSTSVSHVQCAGKLSLHAVLERRYEFSVDNFSAGSGVDCTPGAGEYLTPQQDGTLRYTTGYDPAIDATLKKVGSSGGVFETRWRATRHSLKLLRGALSLG